MHSNTILHVLKSTHYTVHIFYITELLSIPPNITFWNTVVWCDDCNHKLKNDPNPKEHWMLLNTAHTVQWSLLPQGRVHLCERRVILHVCECDYVGTCVFFVYLCPVVSSNKRIWVVTLMPKCREVYSNQMRREGLPWLIHVNLDSVFLS